MYFKGFWVWFSLIKTKFLLNDCLPIPTKKVSNCKQLISTNFKSFVGKKESKKYQVNNVLSVTGDAGDESVVFSGHRAPEHRTLDQKLAGDARLVVALVVAGLREVGSTRRSRSADWLLDENNVFLHNVDIHATKDKKANNLKWNTSLVKPSVWQECSKVELIVHTHLATSYIEKLLGTRT